jgi:predicted outer membrane repeat protein
MSRHLPVWRRRAAIVISTAGLALVATPMAVHAATVTVPCTGNNATDTAALTTAMQSYSSGDTISLGAGCTFSYASSTGWPEIDNTLILDANGDTITASASGIIFFGVEASGNLTVNNVTISDADTDTDGPAIFSDGVLTVNNSTFTDNHAVSHDGGAIASEGSGTLTVTGSTFSGNIGDGDGGAIHNDGPATIINSTFDDNSSAEGSAFFENGGTGTIINSTFAGNTSGFAIWNESGTTTVKNTIIAENPGGNCTGTVADGGYNDEDGTACAFSNHFQHGDPLLGALANNGGPTETMAISASSIAYHTASTAVCAAAAPAGAGGIDQRGDPRGATACDIGAFEVQAAAPTSVPVPASGGVVLNTPSTLSSGLLLAGGGGLILLFLLAAARRRRPAD